MKKRFLFVDDITVQGSYFAVTIRSPIAKGRLKSIELPSMPNSYTLITGDAIPGANQLEDFPVPILSSMTLSYIGEPVAILLGPNERRLREYAEQCRVIAEEGTPIFSSRASETIFGARDISIHEHYKDTKGAGGEAATGEEAKSPETIKQEAPEEEAEITKVQEPGKANILQGAYKTGIQEHWYADPHGATAIFSTGKMTVYTAGQWPFHIKQSVSQVLNLSPDAVTVELSRIGMHLDGKIWYPSLIACHAALGAFIIKKPVKLILTRDEDFRYSPKRNAAEIEFRSALGDKGELLETEIRVIADIGAQGAFTDEILDRTCLGCLGAYRVGPVRLAGTAVKTNIPPQGPLSGFGLSQGFFALERQVSRIADTLRQDPAEWRKTHAYRGNGELAMGVPLEEPPLDELIDTAAKASGYYRKWAAYELLRQHRRVSDWKAKDEPIRGIGIAVAYQGGGFLYCGRDRGVYTVESILDQEGFLEIKTSLISSNNTYIRIWREMAAEILSIEGELVRIHLGNTDTAPDSGPGSNSRNVTAVTRLVESSCRAIQKRRLKESPPIKVRQSCSPVLKAPWEGKSAAPLDRLFDGQALTNLGWGAAVVEVEIDPVDYTPRVRGIWLEADGGRLLSEKQARLALARSAVHALGWAAREELYYTQGKIPDPFIYGYDILTPLETPPIHVGFIRKEGLIPKGIGELPFSTIPAAYVQAVSQAMDHPFEKIPLNARDVWETGKLKKKGAAP
ncbi:MAG: molybdopterin-dependent oxidoreductase [Treponema sp.]|nr:molybdopterin-dependent oxidoreductase [Treponema sp.]